MNKPIFLGIILFLVVFVFLVFYVKNRSSDDEAEVAKSPGAVASSEQAARKINVKLFFYNQDSRDLAAESRSVTYRGDLHAQVREVLTALIQGPEGKLIRTVPEGTRILDVFVQPTGVAYVDFSGELAANHLGGTEGEILTVYSIIDTLTYNFPQIKRVQILLDDRAVETLKGHLDLSRPLEPDLSLANL